MNVRYNLQNPAEAESYIRLVFRYDGQRLVYYPGERIKTAWWNAKTGRVRKTADNPFWQQINAGLDRLAGLCLDIYRRYRNEGQALPLDRFRAELDTVWKSRTMPERYTRERPGLMTFLAEFIAERAASPDYSPNTVRTYRTLERQLQNFALATKYRLDWESVTLEFHAKFTGWLSGRLNLAPNSIHKALKVLKTVLAEAADRGHHANFAYLSKKFTAKREETMAVYLDEGELERLAALDLSAWPGRDRARDLFLIGAATGLRFSDYETVRAEAIERIGEVEVLTVRTRKTAEEVSVPVLPLLRWALDKNGGKAPALLSNQKMNKYLKEVCKLAGIDAPVDVVAIRGGLRSYSTVPKWELISTHTARRSFATNEYLRDPAQMRAIMAILGHKRESTFFQYVKITKRQSAAAFALERGKKAG